jgi:hypothetical protein
MNSNAFCPISTAKIDENVARSNAALTVLFLIIYFVSGSILPVILLLIDFTLRGLELSKYSPFAIVSKYVLATLKFDKQLVNAGPKLFSARIGILFSTLIVISLFLGATIFAFVFAFVFAACAFLEFAFGFCVACKIYPFYYKLIYVSKC